MTQQSKIYIKIAKVMSEVSRVPKNGYNSFQKYNYATESDLTESIRPILNEVGLAFFSTVLDQERTGDFTKVKMEFTLFDTDTGESIKSIYWGEGQDKGDKGLYKAYTGAAKYFFMKTFLIATGDDPEDGEGKQPNGNDNQPKKNQKMASDKQLDLVRKLIIDVANSTGSTEEKTYMALKKHIRNEIEWYSEEDAKSAIKILNAQKGA
ncbi:ERF superfamily protein [Cytobacillus horneckiae]|uniref:ERF family protein n=1 Tax=Cytobacillus horneckiae TaxID=549687 RepID=UPI0019D0A70F|nr:ERF family protein [Cytobacillus horneckiae]MBN6889143.1 ERF family protein [Cytobacillus horneckiae]